MTEEILQQANTTAALTDLAAGLIMIPMFLVLLFHRTEKTVLGRLWALEFGDLAVTFLLGYIAHYYCTGKLFDLMWIPLYAVMTEAVTIWCLIATCLVTGAAPSRRTVLFSQIASLLVYLPNTIVKAFFSTENIRAFVICVGIPGVIAFGFVIRAAFRHCALAEKIIASSLLPLLVVIWLQVRRDGLYVKIIWHFDCDGLAHLLLILSLCIVFAGALLSLRKAPMPAEPAKAKC